MTPTLDALRIVYALAQHSALSRYDAAFDNRLGEYLEQEKALDEISLLMERMENGEVET